MHCFICQTTNAYDYLLEPCRYSLRFRHAASVQRKSTKLTFQNKEAIFLWNSYITLLYNTLFLILAKMCVLLSIFHFSIWAAFFNFYIFITKWDIFINIDNNKLIMYKYIFKYILYFIKKL